MGIELYEQSNSSAMSNASTRHVLITGPATKITKVDILYNDDPY